MATPELDEQNRGIATFLCAELREIARKVSWGVEPRLTDAEPDEKNCSSSDEDEGGVARRPDEPRDSAKKKDSGRGSKKRPAQAQAARDAPAPQPAPRPPAPKKRPTRLVR